MTPPSPSPKVGPRVSPENERGTDQGQDNASRKGTAPTGVAIVSLGNPKQGFLLTPDHESQSPPKLLEQADHRSGRRTHLVAQNPPSLHEHHHHCCARCHGDQAWDGSLATATCRHTQPRRSRVRDDQIWSMPRPTTHLHLRPSPTMSVERSIVVQAAGRRPSHHHPRQMDLGKENPRSAATVFHRRLPSCPRSRESTNPLRSAGAAAPVPRLHTRTLQPQRARPCHPAPPPDCARPRSPASSARKAADAS